MYFILSIIVKTALDNYTKSQIQFVHSIAELATKASNTRYLHEKQVIELVSPLLFNINPIVKSNAVLILARLAENSKPCAKQILYSKNTLDELINQTFNDSVCTNVELNIYIIY